MREAVLHHLATYFDALPYQVEFFDKKVIDHLTLNPGQFEIFQKGDMAEKWIAYRSIKYLV
jgi:hypothetical protein